MSSELAIRMEGGLEQLRGYLDRCRRAAWGLHAVSTAGADAVIGEIDAVLAQDEEIDRLIARLEQSEAAGRAHERSLPREIAVARRSLRAAIEEFIPAPQDAPLPMLWARLRARLPRIAEAREAMEAFEDRQVLVQLLRGAGLIVGSVVAFFELVLQRQPQVALLVVAVTVVARTLLLWWWRCPACSDSGFVVTATALSGRDRCGGCGETTRSLQDKVDQAGGNPHELGADPG